MQHVFVSPAPAVASPVAAARGRACNDTRTKRPARNPAEVSVRNWNAWRGEEQGERGGGGSERIERDYRAPSFLAVAARG